MSEYDIPLVDLYAQYESIKEEIDSAIEKVIDKTAFVGGEEIKQFESNFADFCEVEHAVGVSSGTDALFLALKVLGVGEGDEVIMPSHTFMATAEAVSAVGANPVFVDIDEETYTLNPSKVLEAVNKDTKAVIPVHIYGHPADMDPIMDIADKNDLYVIEDAAQAHGAEYKGQKVGSIGDIACFSFYPGKNLGAYGDAGAITTDNQALAKEIAMLRDHGREKKYEHEMIGFNARLDNLQAAILDVKLSHLEDWNEGRRWVASKYQEKLAGTPLALPKEMKWGRHVYHLFAIGAEDRDELRNFLDENGISTGIHYPIPLYDQLPYDSIDPKDTNIADEIAKTELSLPIYPELKEEHIQYVEKKMRNYFEV